MYFHLCLGEISAKIILYLAQSLYGLISFMSGALHISKMNINLAEIIYLMLFVFELAVHFSEKRIAECCRHHQACDYKGNGSPNETQFRN